ncbi:hypothetical protein MTX26_04375 [Bradyrhizobium sp. ISRA443]|uniref:hypothetical protein n=1 Tax=unclassified Bradyrhizobium TaxID=2631580 RepID=UPI00247B0E4C|nr:MULTISPECIES: hypothetical protein [unclassified Bradyrhizobium]WGR95179.1 hypothetical protein MTX20_14510 [Bradyrhizobium sp. ISRA435]WGS00100.1 hypothetical protein MTX23_04375 [Bradyrhizobium sp. ISRA436]WGS06989.1 hypothetical protein MTX18_04375 [Bradyrhizobium sp. ISRA437]WGS13871.1 hypothetical protein MTX26_04375 [Bradyrhizobium sp. ISRA443]
MTKTPASCHRVRFATYRNDETGETTPLYLHSHEAIDAEIDQRIRADVSRAAQHEATRAKWHSEFGRRVAA